MIHSDAPAHRPFRLTWPPLLFSLVPSSPSFAREAPYKIDHRAWIPAPAEQVYDEFCDCEHARDWVRHFVHLEQLTPEAPPERRVYEESFTFMSVRVRTLEAQRGRRWLGSIERCTLPLARQILQEVTFEPVASGGTNFRWRVYYTPSWLVRPVLGILRSHFDQMFRQSTEQLAAFFRDRQRERGAGNAEGASHGAPGGL